MFTGLVQAKGRVAAVEPRAFGVRLVIDPQGWGHRPEHGESISVSGACLTVAEAPGRGAALAFDVVAETLSKTTLGGLRPGSEVNLERSCRPEDLLGGHLVQGHVDGVGVVREVRADPADWRVAVEPPDALMEYAAPKGSVCIDGVSLTIAALVGEDGRRAGFGREAGARPRLIEVALIPTTLAKTTLGALKENDRVHLEMDAVGKQVVHWLRVYGGG